MSKVIVTKESLDLLAYELLKKANSTDPITLDEIYTAVKTCLGELVVEIDNDDDMAAALASADAGSIYRFTGLVSDIYTYGSFYEVVSE